MKTEKNPQIQAYTGAVAPEEQHDGDPRDFFRVLWRRKWLILLCLVLIPLAVYFYSDRLTKTYQASTLIQVQDTATDSGLIVGTDLPSGSANTAKIAALVGTSGVAELVISSANSARWNSFSKGR